jgi:SAM-dependent methyltransferase
MSPAASDHDIDYGVDAPGVIRALLLSGISGLVVALVLVTTINAGWGDWLGRSIALVAAIPTILGLSMVAYVCGGKLQLRDAIIKRHKWRGDETVLDIGAGRGLMAIAAAKQVPQGKVIAIDIWSEVDLTDNMPDAIAQNAALEEVADRIEIVTGDARKLDLPDASIDVVVSVLCIHNIQPATDRVAVCHEIVRVLRPGGTAYIADYILTSDYARAFSEGGLHVKGPTRMENTALTLMALVEATKANAR